MMVLKGQIKKIHVFRVTLPYLNLLVKQNFFQLFWKKEYNFMHFVKLNFFPEKIELKKKYVCLPYLKFQTRYLKHTFFIWPYYLTIR